jgi:Protein of unknown function (DUF3421)
MRGRNIRRNASVLIKGVRSSVVPAIEMIWRGIEMNRSSRIESLLSWALALFVLSITFAGPAMAWTWTPWSEAQGHTMPPGAFIGGTEQVAGENRTRQLFVCQIEDGLKGVHPGKVVEGRCNIGYDSKEVRYSTYRALTGVVQSHWVPGNNGSFPPNAFEGGREPNRTLFVCRGPYMNGVHPGKIVDRACNIPWGGREPHLQNYEVLVGDK